MTVIQSEQGTNRFLSRSSQSPKTWSSPWNSKSALSLVACLQNYLMPAVTVAFELTVLYIVYSVLKSLFLNSRINDFLTKHSLVFGTVELNLLYTYIVPKEGFLDVLMKKAYTKCF